MGDKVQEDLMQQAFAFIKSYVEKEGISPTIREVQEYLGLGSVSTAYIIIQKLKTQGMIDTKRRIPRSIAICR